MYVWYVLCITDRTDSVCPVLQLSVCAWMMIWMRVGEVLDLALLEVCVSNPSAVFVCVCVTIFMSTLMCVTVRVSSAV